MLDIFKLEEEIEPIKMTSDLFFKKTKELLGKINDCYSLSYEKTELTEEEFPDESNCNACKGCGTFGIEEVKECFIHEDCNDVCCYHIAFHHELFKATFEDLLESIYEILKVDALVSNT
jgi:hypothetical protein